MSKVGNEGVLIVSTMMDSLLSNSYILTVIFISVLLGFGCTVFVLNIFDSRVYDIHGKLLPGSVNHLWGPNFLSVVVRPRKEKRLSESICNDVLPNLGDGNIAAFNVFGWRVVFIGHPELAKSVLSGHYLKFQKTYVASRVRAVLGDGLLYATGNKWQTHRQLIYSGFINDSSNCITSSLNWQSLNLVNKWLDVMIQLKQEKFRCELSIEIRKYTFSMCCHFIFGYDFQVTGDFHVIYRDLELLLHEIDLRSMDPTDWWCSINTTRSKTWKAAHKRFTTLLDGIIEARIEEHSKHDIYHANSNDEGSPLYQNNNNGTHNTSHIATTPQQHDAYSSSPQKHRRNGTAYGFKHHILDDDISPNDLLDVLLLSYNNPNVKTKFTVAEIRDQILSLLIASYEHLSATLLWILYELCCNPSIQRKCQIEIDKLMMHQGGGSSSSGRGATGGPASSGPSTSGAGNNTYGSSNNNTKNTAFPPFLPPAGPPPLSSALSTYGTTTTHNTTRGTNSNQKEQQEDSINNKLEFLLQEDVEKFSYLIQVIKETMRLHPSKPYISRKNVENCNIGEYTMKSNATIVICTKAIHQHPHYWYQPLEFDPDRFATENIHETLMHPFQYLPFSIGPRNCIGQRYAFMELIVTLVMLLSNYEFSMDNVDRGDVLFEETSNSHHPVHFYTTIKLRDNINNASTRR